MLKLTMTKGLPASGKSTWAKEEVLKSRGNIKRVNKDDLRAMIDAGQWSRTNERDILQIRDCIVKFYLSHGSSVIVDDTNLAPRHEEELEAIASELGAEFEIKSFLDVSLATCILRNAKRENPVPEQTIKSMYNSFIRKKGHVAQYSPPPFNPDLPNCIIVDIDGTLAHITDRSPYDYSKVLTDSVDTNIRDILYRYANKDPMTEIPDTYIIIVSGRDGTVQCRADTIKWLQDNQIPYDEFYMRDPERVNESGHQVNDTIIKQEIYETYIKPRFNVRFVLDDRDRVVNKWRELGLKCLQVEPGDF
jgi:predicted kinase